jgi:hypothetical protein
VRLLTVLSSDSRIASGKRASAAASVPRLLRTTGRRLPWRDRGFRKSSVLHKPWKLDFAVCGGDNRSFSWEVNQSSEVVESQRLRFRTSFKIVSEARL